VLLNENDAYALIVESLRLKDVAGRLEVITGSLLVILNNGSKILTEADLNISVEKHLNDPKVRSV
jgi:hypothetical protein